MPTNEQHLVEARRIINEMMKAMRPDDPSEERERRYTQEVHNAFVSLFALMQDNCMALLDRVKALEAADSYKGTWQRAMPYRKGAQVTHKGGLWVALLPCDAGQQPGDNPAHWQLAAKGTG